MASNQEMFQFISNFGPMLGELAAHVDYLERRVEVLEGRGFAPAAPGADPSAAPDEPEAVFEFMGQKIDMRKVLEGGMPAGGVAGMMERLKSWRPGAAPAAESAAAPAPAPAPGAQPTPKTT